MRTVAIVGTFDSKGEEFLFVKNQFESLGIATLTIHTGIFEPYFIPHIANEEVCSAAGVSLEQLSTKKDRAFAMETMQKGIERLVPELFNQGKFDGIISLGGSGGTALATAAMRALPIGVPKLMVSTMASGNTSQYVGTSDIIMLPSIVDVSGLNGISNRIFQNAVFAMAGMLSHEPKEMVDPKPLVAATMFGVTTPCVDKAKDYLESAGYEVLVFHATGTGGLAMEALVRDGYFKGVLDLTTTEWCDEIVGGVLNAGPNRLEAAGLKGIPQVVSVGAVDMVNFGPIETVPSQFKERNLYKHNATVTLMRTNVEENRAVGQKIAEKLNMATGKTVLMLPLKGVSMIDAPDQPFYGPEEDQMLFQTLRDHIDESKVELIALDHFINDEDFAVAAAKKLIDLMAE